MRIEIPDCMCQDCGQEEWTISVSSTHGPLYLCNECGLEAMENRESTDKYRARAYGKLVSKIYGAASGG